MKREEIIVNQGQQDVQAARTMGASAVLQAIPLFVWGASIFLLFLFIALAIGFHLQQMSEFVNNALRWCFAALVVLVVVLLARLMYKAYGIYHEVITKYQERRVGSANVQRHLALAKRAELQNEELEARIELMRDLPRVAYMGAQAGFNVSLDVKAGKVDIQSYLSNIHSIEQGQIDRPAGQQLLPAPDVPPFRVLLEEGTIQTALKDEQFVLGYEEETGALRYGSWLDLYSCAIGGVSGSGKSTTVRFLLFQSMLAGGRFIFIDPHIKNEEESLAAQFRMFPGIHQFPPCDASVNAVQKRIDWLQKEWKRREKTGLKTPLVVLVIDEFNAIMRVKDIKSELSDLLLVIEQEARKFGIFAMLIGQRWSAQDIGGADIRSSLASKLAHRFSDEDQAVRFMGHKHGPKLLELETGHWLFYDTKGKTTRMVTPATVANDGVIVTELLADRFETRAETRAKPRETTPQIPERTTGSLARGYDEITEESTNTEPEISPESTELIALARQIMALQAEGKQKSEIMRQVWGVNPGGSQEYRAAQVEYQEVMQFIASQIGVQG